MIPSHASVGNAQSSHAVNRVLNAKERKMLFTEQVQGVIDVRNRLFAFSASQPREIMI